MKQALIFCLVALLYPLQSSGQAGRAYSDHTDPQAGTHYQTGMNAMLCVNCSISNAYRAADNNPDNFATLSQLAAVSGTMRLRLRLSQMASLRAGMVIENPGTLITASMLAGVTIRTFRDGIAREWRTGGTHLIRTQVTIGDLPSNRMAVWFDTSEDFDEVEIEVGGLANVMLTTRVYTAFGDFFNVPLPVSLLSFSAAGSSSGRIVQWQSASEENVSHYELEMAENITEVQEPVAVARITAANKAQGYRYYCQYPAGCKIVYYRLKVVDLDGSYSHSHWIATINTAQPDVVLHIADYGRVGFNIQSEQTAEWYFEAITTEGKMLGAPVHIKANKPEHTLYLEEVNLQQHQVPYIVKVTCPELKFSRSFKILPQQ